MPLQPLMAQKICLDEAAVFLSTKTKTNFKNLLKQMSGGQRFDRAPSMLKPYVACDDLVMELLVGIVDCHHLVVVVVVLEVRQAPSRVKNGQKWSGHVMTVTTTPQIPENQG